VLLDQASYRLAHAKNCPKDTGNRPSYHLTNITRYLHLDKQQQRRRVLPKLLEHNWEMMEAIMKHYKRKPLVMLASSQQIELMRLNGG